MRAALRLTILCHAVAAGAAAADPGANVEQGLGDAFTPAVKDAWATVYGVLAGTMKSAAAEAAA